MIPEFAGINTKPRSILAFARSKTGTNAVRIADHLRDFGLKDKSKIEMISLNESFQSYVNHEPLYSLAHPSGDCRGNDRQTRKQNLVGSRTNVVHDVAYLGTWSPC